MLRKLLYTLLFAFLSLPILAQESTFSLIPVLGGNMGFERNWLIPMKPRYGLYAGARFQLALTEKFVVGTGLIYSQKGATLTMPFPDANGNIITGRDVIFRYNYLEAPLYLGVPIRVSDKFVILPTLALNTGIYLHGGVKFKGLKTQSTSSVSGIAYDVGTVLSVAGIFKTNFNPILLEFRFNPSWRADFYVIGLNTGIIF